MPIVCVNGTCTCTHPGCPFSKKLKTNNKTEQNQVKLNTNLLHSVEDLQVDYLSCPIMDQDEIMTHVQ